MLEAIPIQNMQFQHELFLESFGVKICVRSNEACAIDAIVTALPSVLADRYRLTDPFETNHEFYYKWNKTGRDSLYKKREKILTRTPRQDLLDQLGTHVRLTVAEFAVDRVFVHAGVVALDGKAIVIPGMSFSGKTSLVAEFVKQGAIYYSDEYAVLDLDGLVHPFAKPLSIRANGEKKQVDLDVIKLGGIQGTEPIEVGMVVFTQFSENGNWKPKKLSRTETTFELIRYTIPIRRVPEFTIGILDLAIKDARAFQSERREAPEVASWAKSKLRT